MARRNKVQNIVYNIFMFILGIIMIYPVLWMVSSSLKNLQIYLLLWEL